MELLMNYEYESKIIDIGRSFSFCDGIRLVV